MVERSGFHEDFRQENVAPGSDRGFGLVLATFFALIGALKLWRGHAVGGVWCAAGLVFFVLAVARPKVLAPLNHLWLKLGLLLYKVVNPLVMALMFYLTILPIGLLMRLFRKDPLSLKRDPRASSYWIERRPPGPAPDTMRKQF
jgi:hypothetical protein